MDTAGTDIQALIRRNLDAVGRTGDTALTAFTDGCPGLRRILADAGVTTRPMLDWFHVAVRLQHLKQIADGLSADDPAQVAAKAVIVAEVKRLHWRIWSKHPANTAALLIPDAGLGLGFAIGDQLSQELDAGGRKGRR